MLRSLALVLTLAGCTRTPPPGLPAGTTLDDLPDAETWGARLRTSDDGRPRIELDAPYLARYHHAPASARLDLSDGAGGVDSSAVFLGPPPEAAGSARADSARVSVRLFGADGTPAATVTAGRAWLHEASGRLVAEGRVEATVAGARVTAARLVTTRDGAFTASGGATATLTGQAQATVRAQTLTGTAGGTRYEASGGAHVDAAGGRRLDAGRIVWDEAAARFRAPGAFSFDGPGARVRGIGLDATADLSRYSFRRASGQIEVRQ